MKIVAAIVLIVIAVVVLCWGAKPDKRLSDAERAREALIKARATMQLTGVMVPQFAEALKHSRELVDAAKRGSKNDTTNKAKSLLKEIDALSVAIDVALSRETRGQFFREKVLGELQPVHATLAKMVSTSEKWKCRQGKDIVDMKRCEAKKGTIEVHE